MTTETTPVSPTSQRLMSLDALRGFDMFWIVGGASIIAALHTMTGWAVFERILAELHHPEWHGFTFYDMIFPLFLFIAGVAIPYSFAHRLAETHSKGMLYWRVIRRGILLVLLGLIYQGMLRGDFGTLRYPSVLGRIGLAYMFAGLITLNTRPRGQLAWAVGLLLGYWAAMMWIPVPGYGAGDLTPGHTICGYVDRNLLPGHLYKIVRDPEGIFSTVPAIATALLGVLTGHWLRLGSVGGHAKAAVMFLSGLVLLGIGWRWNSVFPVNKNLWSSSFVLVAGGWSLMFLAVFYWVIDVAGYRKWAFPFVVIGMNAITVYLAGAFVNFQALAGLIFAQSAETVGPALFSCLGFGLRWLMAYVMFRQKWFLKV